MKKRLVSMLLSLCVVAALLCGMTVTAFADGTQEYTIKAGDTVYGICQKLGIDYAANLQWIKDTNNIVNFNNMKAGTVLTLPAAGTTPGAAATTAAAANTTAAAATDAAANNALTSGDTVSYYLVDHVMAAGETVYSVCQQLGIDFAANSDKIKSMNGINNYNNVKVGATIQLPSTSVPASGTYTQIVAHKVVAGDTVGALCRSYGIDYASNVDAIKSLSGIDNLGAIKVGQTLYLPVKASSSATTTTTTAAATTTTTTTPAAATATGVAPAAPVNTTPEAGAFNVHTSSNGVFNLQVNGQIVNSAPAGATVTVVTIPDQGYKVNDIIVYKTSSTERVTVTNSTFVMPAYDITIYVTFRAG